MTSRHLGASALALGAGVAVAAVVLGATLYFLRAPERVAAPGNELPSPVPAAPQEGPDLAERWQEMEAVEQAIRDLEPTLRELSSALMDLQLPTPELRERFGDPVQVVDLAAAAPRPLDRLSTLGAHHEGLPVQAGPEARAAAELSLWRPLLERVAYFERAKLKLKDGRFAADDPRSFIGRVVLDAVARLHDDRLAWVRGHLELGFERQSGEGEDPVHRIVAFTTHDLDLLAADRRAFAEQLDHVLETPQALEAARRSVHEELIVELKGDPTVRDRHPHFEAPSVDRHPGVAVVDLDADGFDDFYVLVRQGRNLFFRNRGDGSFEEIGETLGLALPGNSSSAIFADFDNDSDADLYVGRTLERSVLLRNDGGRFVDVSDTLPEQARPYLVSSVAAADYDGDGLLDLYVSTYAQQMVVQDYFSERPPDQTRIAAFVAPDQLERLWAELRAGRHKVADLAGPPNVLLRNVGGGRFERDVAAEAVSVYSNTYQSTFADYDDDGDPDLYLASDFGPNHLFRNDGGRFVDVSGVTDAKDVGFGMGASFGDYDNDGRQDLYVTNMYSSAGTRITARLPGLALYQKLARGNTLLRNQPDGFVTVSGNAPPAMMVERAGWSWGGQLVDLDNDRFLDVVALSGHFTAPRKFELPVDV